ncbi:MAG TPA: hypothetical protein VN578_10160, partial [Candidatus Binatia bacterium]|nr:hypothetical protein [Candidatus Binatia bacterium]
MKTSPSTPVILLRSRFQRAEVVPAETAVWPARWAWPVLLALGLVGQSQGAQRTWTGGGADNNWGTALNWDTGAPVSNDSVLFSGATRLQPTNNLANLMLNGMGFNTSQFNVLGLSVTNNAGILDIAGNNTNNIPQIMPASQGITNNAGLAYVNAGTINLTNAGVNLWLAGAGPVFLNGVISGAGMLTLGNDGGSVRLGAANTFKGGVNINNNGTVVVANAGAFPNGAGIGDVTNNGTINLNATSITVNGLYGAGTVDNLSGTATYTVTVGNNSTNPAGSFSGSLQNSSGSVALTKVNTNTFTLNGTASHTGATTISAGTLVLGASGNISSTPLITVNPGAVLDVSAQSGGFSLGSGQTLRAGRTTNGGPSDITGSFSSSGTIQPLRAAAAGTMTVNGGLTLSGGTVNFDLANTNTLGSGSNDLIVVSGQLTLIGVTTIGLNPLAGAFASGSYTLISNTTALVTGSPANLTADLPRGLAATFDTTTTPGSLLLTMSGTASPASLVWSASASSDWDVRLTQNWLNGGVPDYFFNLDNVTFSDSANSVNVNLNNGVSPGSILFANSATNYIISGSG